MNLEVIFEKVKSHDRYAQKILSIENQEDKNKISYISFGVNYMNKPVFSIQYITIDLKVEIRDFKIDELLNSLSSVGTFDDFNVEEIIYTDAQLERLRELRGEKQNDSKYWSNYYELVKFKKEYSDNFKVGEPVYYNNSHGIITFKHQPKDKSKNSLWSVKVNDTEFRYVDGTKLAKRKIEDLSSIPIDKELDKFPTEKLLKMYKKSRVRGVGDQRIKRILNEREHIQKGETKIINLPH
jgi:hypothetical protein